MDISEASIRKAEYIIAAAGLPPCPRIYLDISNEVNKPLPDLARISELVNRDLSLAAIILQVANSPFYGLAGRIDSISQAIGMLGSNNLLNIVVTVSLRNVIGIGDSDLARALWRHSLSTAMLSAHIARKSKIVDDAHAYTAGLFHDCGVAILLKKFPLYRELVGLALAPSPVEGLPGKFDTIIGFEVTRFRTSHATISYIMAKTWGLSDTCLAAILNHHDVEWAVRQEAVNGRLAAILHVADFLDSSNIVLSGAHNVDRKAWLDEHKGTLNNIDIDEDKFGVLEDESCALINDNEWF